MNINANAKRVFCYGDSLVFGKVSGANERLSVNERWSGILQQILGTDWEVIEEGLRARNLAWENPFFTERDGLQQFGSIIGSHLGFDILVLALGTNDANNDEKYPRKLESLGDIVDQYINKLTDWCNFLEVKMPKILFVLPPDIDETHYDSGASKIFGAGAQGRLIELKSKLENTLRDKQIAYVDAATVCKPAAGDGIHLDIENNKKLAQAVADKIKSLA